MYGITAWWGQRNNSQPIQLVCIMTQNCKGTMENKDNPSYSSTDLKTNNELHPVTLPVVLLRCSPPDGSTVTRRVHYLDVPGWSAGHWNCNYVEDKIKNLYNGNLFPFFAATPMPYPEVFYLRFTVADQWFPRRAGGEKKFLKMKEIAPRGHMSLAPPPPLDPPMVKLFFFILGITWFWGSHHHAHRKYSPDVAHTDPVVRAGFYTVHLVRLTATDVELSAHWKKVRDGNINHHIFGGGQRHWLFCLHRVV